MSKREQREAIKFLEGGIRDAQKLEVEGASATLLPQLLILWNQLIW